MTERVAATRPARLADAPAIGLLHVRAWQAAYHELMPAAYLDNLSADDRAQMWRRDIIRPRDRSRLLVIELNDCILGFAAVGPPRDTGTDDATGELYAINVDPGTWGTGAGATLLDAATTELAELGFTQAILWVHPENARARRFYERGGWTPDEAARQVEVLGVVVPEVRYRRPLGG